MLLLHMVCLTHKIYDRLSLPAARVIRALNELVEVRGTPLSIRLDNGPEFIALALAEWAQTKGIRLNHIQPGKPTQNAYVKTVA